MTPVSGGWIIRRQVRCLISEVLSDTIVDEEARLGLLRHLAEHPSHPGRALLAQVHDWQDREEGKGPAQVNWPGYSTGRPADVQEKVLSQVTDS
jgi:hypothetical protein